MALSPDGTAVLTTSGDSARIWDTATGKPIGEPLQHQGAIKTVAFSPDGKTVLTGSEDKTARLCDVSTSDAIGKPLKLPRQELAHRHWLTADVRLI
jgi:WD40 repeat protein